MIKIPGDNGWVQTNVSKIAGTLFRSFNLDLESVRGRLRTTRAKLIKTGSGAVDTFGLAIAIVYYNVAIHVFAGSITGDNLYLGGNSPFDTITSDSTSTNAALDDGDAIVFNNLIYATDGANITRYNDTTENSVSAGLTDNTPHLLAVFSPDGNGERLYVTEGNDKVWSVSQANVLASSSSYTLDLSLEPNYQTTVLMAGENSVWVGVSSAGNNSGGGRSIMFEWDGVTANAPTAKYYIDANRLMAGVMKDGVPYVLDSKGRLLAFNGGRFIEVARFPLTKPFISTSSNMNQNAVHPRGMAVDGDELLLCVSNLADGSSGSTVFYNDFPAGVWAYNSRNGLYHKYAPSYQAVADTGTTNLTDYGQFRAGYGGVLKVLEISDPVAADGGHIMFSMGYFTSGSSSLTADQQYGLWTDDSHDDTQKAGWFSTPQISSSVFKDKWQQLFPALSKLLTSGDLVEVKIRVDDETQTDSTCTWSSTTQLHSNDELTDFVQGDEVTIIQGTGAGSIAHISVITTGSGTSITLDRAITGASGTCIIRVEKWQRVAKLEDIADRGFDIGKSGHWLQIKAFLQWTGPREFYGLTMTNEQSVDA